MRVDCKICGDTIATFIADTRRKDEHHHKKAICEDCATPTEEILEELAQLEHKQWMHWSKYIAQNHNIPEQLENKWRENWKPYNELTEEMKDKDRKWARKALKIIHEQQKVDV